MLQGSTVHCEPPPTAQELASMAILWAPTASGFSLDPDWDPASKNVERIRIRNNDTNNSGLNLVNKEKSEKIKQNQILFKKRKWYRNVQDLSRKISWRKILIQRYAQKILQYHG